MFLHARSNTADEGMRKIFVDMSTDGRLLTCEESVGKLMRLLLEDGYQSGAHVDFYDV